MTENNVAQLIEQLTREINFGNNEWIIYLETPHSTIHYSNRFNYVTFADNELHLLDEEMNITLIYDICTNTVINIVKECGIISYIIETESSKLEISFVERSHDGGKT